MVEQRRLARENELWGIPAISIAAQAFLFTTGLSAGTTPGARIVLALVGLVTAIATGAVVIRQGAKAYVMHDWIEKHTDVPDSRQQYDQLKASARETGKPISLYVRLGMRAPGETLFVWLAALAVFATADGFVLAAAIVQIAGGGHLLA
jgi:hypothetical protein